VEYEIAISVKEAGVEVVAVQLKCADIQKAIALLDNIRDTVVQVQSE
jgi:hypothetical protein